VGSIAHPADFAAPSPREVVAPVPRLCDEWVVESPASLSTALEAVLPEAPPAAIRASLPLWGAMRLREDAVLWKQGRPADSLALVISGELGEVLDGTVLGKIGAGQSLGETALFAQTGVRFATTVARAESEVFTLSSAGIAQLRAQDSPVYRALVTHAIAGTAARGQILDRQVSQMRRGNFAEPPAAEASGVFTRLWRRVSRPAAGKQACPPLPDLLASDPVFAQIGPDARAALVGAFQPAAFRAGAVLIRQGDADSRVFVLAAGGADVLRTVEAHGGALLLGSLGPGMLFGINAFTRDVRRTASIVATSDGWYYAMTRDAFDHLPVAAHTAWLEITLAVYIRQHQSASRELQQAIRVFASQHVDLMASNIAEPTRPAKSKQRKR